MAVCVKFTQLQIILDEIVELQFLCIDKALDNCYILIRLRSRFESNSEMPQLITIDYMHYITMHNTGSRVLHTHSGH